jgi:hypothetical protein
MSGAVAERAPNYLGGIKRGAHPRWRSLRYFALKNLQLKVGSEFGFQRGVIACQQRIF